MKYLTTILISIFLFEISYSQQTIPENTGINDKRAYLKQKMMNFLDLQPTDKVVDIGSGRGENILLIASFYPNMSFCIQDIDSVNCNAKVFENEILKSGYNLNISNFKFYYGNEKTTLLPSSTFTKAIMFDLVHELTYKTEMFADFKRILTRDGFLLVSEIIVINKVPKSKDCNYPYMTEAEIKATFQSYGFKVIQQEVFLKLSSNKYVYLFKLKPE